MDVKCIYKFAQDIKRCLKPFWNIDAGETLMSFFERVREWNPRKMRFWRYICCTTRAHMLMEIRYLINKSEKDPETPLVLVEERVAIESNVGLFIRPDDRAPPPMAVFIPIPQKTEMGSCARSDLAVSAY